MPETMPLRIESAPRVGETLRVSSIVTGVRSGFSSTLASSRASFSLKRPVIWADPPAIGFFTEGALWILPSSRMARRP